VLESICYFKHSKFATVTAVTYSYFLVYGS